MKKPGVFEAYAQAKEVDKWDMMERNWFALTESRIG
jgi:hypothetical protein